MQGLSDDLRAIATRSPHMSKVRQFHGKRAHILPMNEERATYEYFRSVYPHDKVIVTEGFLRSVIAMPSNQAQQTISFYFTKNAAPTANISIENKLDLSDVFQVMNFKFGFFTLPGGAAAGQLPTPSVPYSAADIQYFNNAQVFTDGVGTNGYTEAQSFEAAYNSWLYVKLEETVYFEQFPMSQFKKVGISQQGVAVSSVPSTGVLSQTSQNGHDMKVPVTPIIEVTGTGKNDFQLQMQDGMTLSPTINYANRGNYLVLELHGLKCQGANKVDTLKYKV